MRRLQTDERKGQTVEGLRAALPHLSPSSHWRDIDRLPLVCPGTNVQKKRSGMVAETYNGIILLEINNLRDATEAEEVKASAAVWPTTLAALTGASGKSVKVLVGGTLDDGTLPTATEEILRFHERLYKRCASVYEGVVQRPLSTKNATLVAIGEETIEFVKYKNNIVYVRLSGACVDCQLMDVTLSNGIADILINEIPEIKEVRNID